MNTAISKRHVAGNCSALASLVRSSPKVGGEMDPREGACVPPNYHPNLPLPSALPTIKRYELPSPLILPG